MALKAEFDPALSLSGARWPETSRLARREAPACRKARAIGFALFGAPFPLDEGQLHKARTLPRVAATEPHVFTSRPRRNEQRCGANDNTQIFLWGASREGERSARFRLKLTTFDLGCGGTFNEKRLLGTCDRFRLYRVRRRSSVGAVGLQQGGAEGLRRRLPRPLRRLWARDRGAEILHG
jgi:hypothetical protein